MNKKNYISIELKRKLKALPLLLLSTVILSIFIGIIAYIAFLYANDNKDVSKKKIVFMSEDNAMTTKLMVSSIKASKSLNAILRVYQIKPKTATDEYVDNLFKDDEMVAYVHIPKNFLHNLHIGKNPPIEIRYGDNNLLYSLFIMEMATAAQNTLRSAQSGLYTLYDYLDEVDKTYKYDDYYADLDLTYLSKAFERENVFIQFELSKTGELPLHLHYVAMGIILIFLLLSSLFLFYDNYEENFLKYKLHISGFSYLSQTLLNIFVNTIVLYIISIIMYLCILILGKFINIPVKIYFLSYLLTMLVLCLFSAAFSHFLGGLFSKLHFSIISYFSIIIISSYISGYFVPSIFLPGIFEKISDFLFSKHILMVFSSVFTGEIIYNSIIILLIHVLIFIITGIIITSFKLNGYKRRK